MKRVYIIGICGTLMVGIAVLAKQMGYVVSGCDHHVYPPMSTYLKGQGIDFISSFDHHHLIDQKPNLIIVGNAISRGNTVLEYVLAQELVYMSGPAWLARYVLPGRTVLSVAGTHGKTTTSSMIAWILANANRNCSSWKRKTGQFWPGFLIGGIPINFNQSSNLGDQPFFVVEADEYDTSFADKRSKFVHYKPKICLLNALEFDHADIFRDLSAIKERFHHLIRIVPSNGHVIVNGLDANLDEVLAMGCWTPVTKLHQALGWQVKPMTLDGSHFSIWLGKQKQGEIHWSLLGEHNMHNALAAIVVAYHAGIDPVSSIEALQTFKGVKRRLERKEIFHDITVYDDFAHHPTAIAMTLKALGHQIKSQNSQKNIIAMIDLATYSMRHHIYGDQIVQSASLADKFMIKCANTTNDDVIRYLLEHVKSGDCIIFMGNASFDEIYDQFKRHWQIKLKNK